MVFIMFIFLMVIAAFNITWVMELMAGLGCYAMWSFYKNKKWEELMP